jgi:hypothetical protein
MTVEAVQQMVQRIVRGQVRAYLQANPEVVDVRHQKQMTDALVRRISADIGSTHHIDALRRYLKET